VAAEPEALTVFVVHGPNLNLLGAREPEVYGRRTLAEIDAALRAVGTELGVVVRTFQANGEGELIDHIQAVAGEAAGFVVNAGAYTHTSLALADALAAAGRPYVEVHLSNTASREGYRRRSFLARRAVGVVTGFGAGSYLLGLRGLVDHLRTNGPGR
jgi:3-dehydroquinate dehydratase-2